MKAMIEAALAGVKDPELHEPITELGLIYGVEEESSGVFKIRMTMTTPACPYAAELIEQVLKAVQSVEGVTKARVELVWQPPWSTERMSEEAKFRLGVV